MVGVGKQRTVEQRTPAGHVSREAAFVAAFEQTDDDPDNPLVPHENDPPFESFLAAVFSTLLTLLLAWRFLAWNSENARVPERNGPSTGVNETHDHDENNEQDCVTGGSSDSADTSSSGECPAIQSNPDDSCDATSNSSAESSTHIWKGNKKKRRPFDENVAPKRRLNPSPPSSSSSGLDSKKYVDQIFWTDEERQRVLCPPPFELEQGELNSNNRPPWFSSNPRGNNAVVLDWPTTADEDIPHHFVTPTIPTSLNTIAGPNFRPGSGRHNCNGQPSPLIRMISTSSSAISPSENTNLDRPQQATGFENTAWPYCSAVRACSSSVRRPLVSPPPPPTSGAPPFDTSGCWSLQDIGMAHQDSTGHASPNGNDDDDFLDGFLGWDLPHGFLSDITKSTDHFLEDLTLSGSRNASAIVRDLDTITEVSETDDLTSLSSNSGNNEQQKARQDRKRWSETSTAPCGLLSPSGHSECYRLASTLTACSSSSAETVNEDLYSILTPSNGFSPSQRPEKIDHVSRSSRVMPTNMGCVQNDVGKVETGAVSCLPEERPANLSPHQATVVELSTAIADPANDFVTHSSSAPVQRAVRLPVSAVHDSRHHQSSSTLVEPNPKARTSSEFVKGNGLCDKSTWSTKGQPAGEENGTLEKIGGLEWESFSTPTSSGRTSVATDLPPDELCLLEENFCNLQASCSNQQSADLLKRAQSEICVDDDAEENVNLQFPSQEESIDGDIENKSSEETSSPSPVSYICKTTKDRPIINTIRTPSPSQEEARNKNNHPPQDGTKLCPQSVSLPGVGVVSSCPSREHRLLLAYEQYQSLKRQDGGESEFSTTSSSFTSSEQIKTTLLKLENLKEENVKSGKKEEEEKRETERESSSCMDQIDLQKALERFARYSELYGDAPRSGMEEFGANRNDAEDSLDASTFDVASRMSSLQSSGSAAAKMEALLKSTLQIRGSPSSAHTGGGSSPVPSLSMKRDRVSGKDLLHFNKDARTAGGAVHALASSTTVATAGEREMMEGRHGDYTDRYTAWDREGGAGESTKEKRADGENVQVEKGVNSKFRVQPASRPAHRVVQLHDKDQQNRYCSPDPAYTAPLSNINSASTTEARKENGRKANCEGKTVEQQGETRIRPTSAPLTPLLLTNTYNQSSEPVCVASATSQAIINDPDSSARSNSSVFFSTKGQRKILAEASANAVASNPYIALARATTAAASKVAEASNDNLLDIGDLGTVSLVVSSTVTTTKRDFFSTTKSTPDLLFLTSTDVYDVSSLELRNQHQPDPVEMSYRQQTPVQVTPTYGVIPRGTASIFQQKHRELSPTGTAGGRSGRGILRSPERKRQNYGYPESNGGRSPVTTPARDTYQSKKTMFASSDHLQKLLEDPYYVKETHPQHPVSILKPDVIPTPTPTPVPVALSQPTSAKSAPLSQRNVSDWDRLPENSLQNQKQQNLLRWRNSMNLAENEELRQAMLEDQKRAKSEVKSGLEESMEAANSFYGTESKRSSSAAAVRPTTPQLELWDYKIFREEQKKVENEMDDENKRNRRNKYKAKIDRAKRDYLANKASASDLYRSIEDFEKKFNISMENVRLPDPPRGPYLEYLSRSGNLHVLDPSELPPPTYHAPRPRFDREYESIVKDAERRWAAYKKRLHAAAAKYGDDLYARSRAYSMGFLETDIDDQTPYRTGQKSIMETDLDQVQREIEHESRKRSKTPMSTAHAGSGAGGGRNAHSRAKSADYLMDQRARTEIEPPENQLQKILGEKDEKDLSEHELRFRKSTEKLLVPDWYLNSDYCPGGKAPTPDPVKSRLSGYTSATDRPKSTQSHYSYAKSGIETTSPASYRRSRASTPATKRMEDQSRYVSPWVYGGRISGPQGMKTPESIRRRPESPSPKSFHSTSRSRTQSPPKPITRPPDTAHHPQPLRPEPRKIIEHEKLDYQMTKSTSMTSTMYSMSKSVMQSPVERSTSLKRPEKKDDFVLPKHFFDKYKEEIEDMRKSRTALNTQNIDDDEESWEQQQQKRLSIQGLPLPVATVRPTQLNEDELDTTASISFSPTSSPESRPMSRPQGPATKPGQPTPQPRSHQKLAQPPAASRTQRETSFSSTSYRDGPLNTSTPYSSDRLPRKSQTPSSRETAFEPYFGHQVPDEPPSRPAPRPPQVGRQSSFRAAEPRHMPGGWTVSAVPSDWNVPGQRGSVVIEVAGDGLFEAGSPGGPKGRRLSTNLTLEEVLDTIFAVPAAAKIVLPTINESSSSLLDDCIPVRPRTPTNLEGPGIYTQNQELMDKCMDEPEMASELLKREILLMKCGYCTRVRELEDARRRGFVSCHHCYTYYCNRMCRLSDWSRHLDICSYARINTLCKQIILKVRQDPESQFQMSRVAQRGYRDRGRGSVNFRFLNLTMAKNYVNDQTGGWRSLRCPPNDPADFLRYYTVPDLVDALKDPSLVNLCRRYEPRSKFVLSVSIMADIEECPETPTNEEAAEQAVSNQHSSSWYQRGIGGQPVSSANSRPAAFSGAELSWMTDAKKPNHSNGVSKDDIYDYQPPQGQYFVRGDQHRHTVASTTPRHSGNWQSPTSYRPGLLIGPEDADETEV